MSTSANGKLGVQNEPVKVNGITGSAVGRHWSEYAGRSFGLYSAFVVLTGAMTGLLLGYDNGVMGGVTSMESFQHKFFYDSVYYNNYVNPAATTAYCKYNDQILELVISCLYLAAIVACLPCEYITRTYGRKISMIIAGALFIIGAVLMAVAPDLACLFVGRVILGFGLGFGTLVGPVYLAEMTHPAYRGALTTIFQLFVTIGIFVAGLINYGSQFIPVWGWRLPLALAGAPGVIILLAGIVLPDSPNSLAERGRFDKARAEVDVEYADIVEAARQAKLVKNSWVNICKKEYRPQLFVAIWMMIFQQFDGINAIIFYAPILFDSLASGALGGLLNTVIIDAVNVLATLVCIMFIDKVGRRKLLLVASAWMFVTQIIVCALLGHYFAVYGQALPSSVSIGILVVICVYICGHAFGWGPIGWVYPVEIQPLETRPAGAAINVSSNLLFTFVIGQSFPSMLCSMHEYVFLFFAICLIVMGVTVYFLFPETMGTPVERTYKVFQDNKLWVRMCPAICNVHSAALPPPTEDPAVAPTLGNAGKVAV